MALNPNDAVTLDDRPSWAKIRRPQLQAILLANDIAFNPLASKADILKIAEGHGIYVSDDAQLLKAQDFLDKKTQLSGQRYLDRIAKEGAPKQKERMDERLVLASQMGWNELRTYVKEFGITWKPGDTRTVLEDRLKEKLNDENAAAGSE